jgi:predicted phage terminase large subunit-like protein
MSVVDAYLAAFDEEEKAQEVIELGPQQGPQTAFLGSEADIVIYGGAAGGGKSYGLLLEPLRHIDHNPRFGGVIFRRNSKQVRNEGGLWDESEELYRAFGGRPKEMSLSWSFPSGATMQFDHLEYERTVLNWQGSQIPYIGFDELTHFTEKQFFYMLSRNRSSSGVPGYVRATTNPDCDSWVRKLIDWWIGEDGFPIPERAGVIRYFVRVDDTIHWADSPDELTAKHGKHVRPKSLTFIPSKLEDNKILMEKDPAYLANLMALPRVERQRLLGGNWNVRAAAGMYFKRENMPLVDVLPGGWTKVCRYWDKAATKPNENNPDPDWTRGLKMYAYPDGTYVVAGLSSDRNTPAEIEKLIKNTASHDTAAVPIYVEQEPGSAGVADAQNMVRLLSGYDVRIRKPTKNKVTRALPVSAQAEVGNIKVLRAPWNDEFFTELENFPPESTKPFRVKSDEESLGHDDIVDALSGAFNELCEDKSILDVL